MADEEKKQQPEPPKQPAHVPGIHPQPPAGEPLQPPSQQPKPVDPNNPVRTEKELPNPHPVTGH